ncbi:hypothetical protein RB195_017292 [Necator americanus]|uniref:Uncharacterized protein n=1 Tax=Necator americanus TaxID=51031 RepID=A0ABR1C637_NECAM
MNISIEDFNDEVAIQNLFVALESESSEDDDYNEIDDDEEETYVRRKPLGNAHTRSEKTDALLVNIAGMDTTFYNHVVKAAKKGSTTVTAFYSGKKVDAGGVMSLRAIGEYNA